MPEREYQFGDSSIASRRLRLLARVFRPSTAALLADAGPRKPGLAVDLGCGPGWTTRLLTAMLEPHRAVGLDRSKAFLREARGEGGGEYREHDVSIAPLPTGPADCLFCRFLLSHLADAPDLLARWVGELRPAGRLLVEEVAAIHTGEPAFQQYLGIVEAMLAEEGTTLFIGGDLPREVPSTQTVLDRIYRLEVARCDAARMFEMNVGAWRERPYVRDRVGPRQLDRLASELRAAGETDGTVGWELRQVAWERA